MTRIGLVGEIFALLAGTACESTVIGLSVEDQARRRETAA